MVLKKYFLKHKSKVIIDRNYQNFERDKFRVEIDNDILTYDLNNMEYWHFINLFTEIFINYLRVNQGKFKTKDLCKAIINCSRH